jgi:hypothetical protein
VTVRLAVALLVIAGTLSACGASGAPGIDDTKPAEVTVDVVPSAVPPR